MVQGLEVRGAELRTLVLSFYPGQSMPLYIVVDVIEKLTMIVFGQEIGVGNGVERIDLSGLGVERQQLSARHFINVISVLPKGNAGTLAAPSTVADTAPPDGAPAAAPSALRTASRASYRLDSGSAYARASARLALPPR